MGQMKEKHKQNSHPIVHFLTSEGVSEMSEWANEWVSEWVSGASERAIGRAIDPVLQSVFLVALAHSAL